jgi:hypothetical protein
MAKKVAEAESKRVPSDEMIAGRAYEIWQSEGCPEGRAWEHWFRAVSELKAECSEETQETEERETPTTKPRAARRSGSRTTERRFVTSGQ